MSTDNVQVGGDLPPGPLNPIPNSGNDGLHVGSRPLAAANGSPGPDATAEPTANLNPPVPPIETSAAEVDGGVVDTSSLSASSTPSIESVPAANSAASSSLVPHHRLPTPGANGAFGGGSSFQTLPAGTGNHPIGTGAIIAIVLCCGGFVLSLFLCAFFFRRRQAKREREKDEFAEREMKDLFPNQSSTNAQTQTGGGAAAYYGGNMGAMDLSSASAPQRGASGAMVNGLSRAHPDTMRADPPPPYQVSAAMLNRPLPERGLPDIPLSPTPPYPVGNQLSEANLAMHEVVTDAEDDARSPFVDGAADTRDMDAVSDVSEAAGRRLGARRDLDEISLVSDISYTIGRGRAETTVRETV